MKTNRAICLAAAATGEDHMECIARDPQLARQYWQAHGHEVIVLSQDVLDAAAVVDAVHSHLDGCGNAVIDVSWHAGVHEGRPFFYFGDQTHWIYVDDWHRLVTVPLASSVESLTIIADCCYAGFVGRRFRAARRIDDMPEGSVRCDPQKYVCLGMGDVGRVPGSEPIELTIRRPRNLLTIAAVSRLQPAWGEFKDVTQGGLSPETTQGYSLFHYKLYSTLPRYCGLSGPGAPPWPQYKWEKPEFLEQAVNNSLRAFATGLGPAPWRALKPATVPDRFESVWRQGKDWRGTFS